MSTPRAGRASASRPQGRRTPERPPAEVLRDLATVLAGDQAVYLRLGPEGAVMSVKSAESFAEGDAIGSEWLGMTPEDRARAVFGWIRKAAKYCRKPRIRWVPA